MSPQQEPSGVSVVVPAHDEAGVIERCLASLREGARERALEVVVVCNGCTDDTAERARRVMPEAVVVETPVASKHHALALGDERATRWPRCYVDADVVVSPGALDRVADALESGACAAAPRPVFDLARSGPGTRLFLEVWQRSPYWTDDLVGSGFYGLSREARERLGPWPPVVADDYWVASSFRHGERRGVDGATFTPLLPVDLRAMVRIQVRHHAAHAELHAWLQAQGRDTSVLEPPTRGGWLRPLARDPRWWPALAVYVGVKVAAKAGGVWRHRSGRTGWARDQAGRDAAARSSG